MHRLAQTLFFAAALLTTSAATAQTYKYTTLPPGYLTTDTKGYCSGFGNLANGRIQFGDNSLAGRIKILMGADCRLRKNYYYRSYYGMGRTWTNVSLTLADCDLDKLTTTFDSNATGVKTEVFQNAMSWPTVTTGTVTSNPWGSQFTFKFSKVFLSAGKNGLFMDFKFAGGKLANNATWSSYGSTYYLEGIPYQSSSVSLRPTYIPKTPFGTSGNTCNDSAQTYTYSGAYVYAYGAVYGDNYYTTSMRRTFNFTHYTQYTAPWASLIQFLCLGGNDTGIDIGAKCNKLHVDLTKTIHTTLQIADKWGRTGSINGNGQYNGYPYAPGLGGLPLYIQGGWTDSKTRQLALTVASKIVLPQLPGLKRRLTVYQSGTRVYLTTSTYSAPLLRLWHK